MRGRNKEDWVIFWVSVGLFAAIVAGAFMSS